MTRQLIVAWVLLLCCFLAARADDSVVVEVQTAVDDAPAALKAGNLVDLLQLNGKTITRTGKVSYNMTSLAQKLEVVSVLPVEKTAQTAAQVQVKLRVTKSQAALIERAKARTVTVMETTTDGKTTTVKKPIPLRLEFSKPEKK